MNIIPLADAHIPYAHHFLRAPNDILWVRQLKIVAARFHKPWVQPQALYQGGIVRPEKILLECLFIGQLQNLPREHLGRFHQHKLAAIQRL